MKAPWFPLYTGDFLASTDVQLMEAHEIGAYLLLLMHSWQSDTPGQLPNDAGRLRRLCRLSVEQWKDSGELLLSKWPISATDPALRYNPRLLKEAARQVEMRELKAEAGRKSAERRALISTERQQSVNTNSTGVEINSTGVGILVNYSQPQPQPQVGKPTSSKKPLSDFEKKPDGLGFDLFWQAYGRKEGSKSKMTRQWDALPATARQAILTGLPAYRQAKTANGPQYMPMPATFLNGKLWECETYGQAAPLVRQTPNEIPSNWNVHRQGPYLAPKGLGMPAFNSYLKPEFQ